MTRNRFAIHRDILVFCKEPTRKTAIQQKCNMSYLMLEKYLAKLVAHEFLIESKELYQTTAKGTRLIEAYGKIEGFLEKTP